MKACILFSARGALETLKRGAVFRIRGSPIASTPAIGEPPSAALGPITACSMTAAGSRRALIPLACRGRRQCEALRRSGWSNRRRGTLPCRSREPSEGGRIHFNQHSPGTTHPMTLTDHNGDLSLDGAERFTEIRCPVCGSPAFIYPRVLDDDKPVICAGCGAFVSTYGEMKRRSEEG
jgi:ribosomal protein S27E